MAELLTVGEMAAKLRVSIATVYRLLNGHKVPGAFRLGHTGGWRIPEECLEDWIQEMSDHNLRKSKPTRSEQ